MMLRAQPLRSAIPNIRDALPNYALHHFQQTKKNLNLSIQVS